MPKTLKNQTKTQIRASPIREVTETFDMEVFTEAAEDGTLGAVRGVLARGNVVNLNKRFYPTSVFRKAAEAAAGDLASGRIIGLLDHPSEGEGDRGRPERTAIRWDALTLEGDNLIGTGVIVGTSVGREVSALRKAKVALGLSTNGYATTKFMPAHEVTENHADPNELIAVIQDDFKFLTIDLVGDPSNIHAAIQQESLQRLSEAEKEEVDDMKELEELKVQLEAEQAARATAEAAAQEAIKAFATQERTNLVNVTAARHPHLPEAVVAAMHATATAAESVDAATLAVTQLAESIPVQSNGNNKVPAAEETVKTTFDAMREYRANA